MYRRILFLFMILAIATMACSVQIGAPASTPTTTPAPETDKTEVSDQRSPTEEPTEPSEEKPTETAVNEPKDEPASKPGSVTSLDDVKTATVQIVAEGSFVDPQWGAVLNAAGAGTGFIIDPEGIAVTNNHVVTGAALLKVYVGGETKPRNAKVLGVSECSDLAVIDIDGDDYPFLDWYEGEMKVGLDVYAAGFPLGEPEYTLTRGILSKTETHGETNWASIDGVIMHDATINPGNSGGPLVTEDGKLIGVNYALDSGANQYFTIAQEQALPVIEQLREGNDMNSLGINGRAVVSEDLTFSGIWVSSVASGSPADKAGLKGGDIVTQLENVVLATDGTMADYCDILRSHDASDTMNISVIRFADMSFMEGQINGRPLAASMSFAQTLGDEVSDDGSNTGSVYSEWVTVTDDSGSIQVEIPAEWAEVDGTPWETNWGSYNITAPSVTASANLNNYATTWDESGVFFAASSDMGRTGGYMQLLDGVRDWYRQDCRLDSTSDYEDELYEGKYDLWKNCGPNKSYTLVLTARPKAGDKTEFLILLEMRITSDADLDALDHILNSFVVAGGV